MRRFSTWQNTPLTCPFTCHGTTGRVIDAHAYYNLLGCTLAAFKGIMSPHIVITFIILSSYSNASQMSENDLSHQITTFLRRPTAECRIRERENPCSKSAWANWFFLYARKLMGTAKRPSSLGMRIGPTPHHCSPIGRAPLHSSVKTSTRCFHWGRKLQSRHWSALSSGRFAGSKSQGVGRWAPAATRFIAFAPNFPSLNVHPTAPPVYQPS